MIINRERGAGAIKTILTLAILAFAGFFGFQTISSILIKSDIHNTISDRLGVHIGDFLNLGEIEKVRHIPMEVLRDYEKRGKIRLSKTDVAASYIRGNDAGKVEFYYQYTLVINLLVTEKTEVVKKHGSI